MTRNNRNKTCIFLNRGQRGESKHRGGDAEVEVEETRGGEPWDFDIGKLYIFIFVDSDRWQDFGNNLLYIFYMGGKGCRGCVGCNARATWGVLTQIQEYSQIYFRGQTGFSSSGMIRRLFLAEECKRSLNQGQSGGGGDWGGREDPGKDFFCGQTRTRRKEMKICV